MQTGHSFDPRTPLRLWDLDGTFWSSPSCPGASLQETHTPPRLPGHVTCSLTCLASSLLVITPWLVYPHSLQLLAPQTCWSLWRTPAAARKPHTCTCAQKRESLSQEVRNRIYLEDRTDCSGQGREFSDKHTDQHTVYRQLAPFILLYLYYPMLVPLHPFWHHPFHTLSYP